MTTSALPDDLAARLAPKVAAYIAAYAPKVLPPERWETIRAAVCEVAAGTEPVSREDAKSVLTALCGYLAWAELKLGNIEPREVLVEAQIRRYAAERRGSLAPSTLDNRLALLRRALRVLGDAPARTKRGARPAGPRPYGTAELAGLDRQAANHGELRWALGLGLALGIVVPHAYTTPAGDRSVTRTTLTALGQRWEPTQMTALTKQVWLSARTAARRGGVDLRADRLRATWVEYQLRANRSFVAIVVEHSLTRDQTSNTHVCLSPLPDPGAYRRLLRG